MITTLKSNERLVSSGMTAVRALNGEPLPAVPQYMIVKADKADPAAVVELKANERLILVGAVITDRKAAEERYSALLAGQAPKRRTDGTLLYIKEAAENINPKTGLSCGEEKACDQIVDDLFDIYSLQRREMRAAERQRRQGKCTDVERAARKSDLG